MSMDRPPSYEQSQEFERRRTGSQLQPSVHDRRRGNGWRNMRDLFPTWSSPRTPLSGWRPIALGPPVLLGAILIPIALIAILQIFLERSQRDGGLIFAPNVNDLPIQRSFCYLYLGTIISVLYSILWAWIDLDAKRLEPFHQLSKTQGSTGRDSLLLHYPFDFIASVPIKAILRRHWPVFWASTCVILVFWGVTPFQAGIFATETITKQIAENVLVSTSFLPVSQQRTEMTANFTYSAFGITWLNETLPPFTTPQYVLAPFKLERNGSGVAFSSENVTANTRLYSVDINCETATIFTPKNESEVEDFPSIAESYYMSTTGCRVPRPYGPTGNDTMGGVGVEEVKKYTSLYAGYWDDDGWANYYMSLYCPRNASRTFLAAFTENKAKDSDPPKTPTVLFCNSTYYYQDAQATVSLPDNKVVNMTALGEATVLPDDMFNITDLELQMNVQRQPSYVRGEIPGSVWPDQTETLSTTDISLRIAGSILPLMSGLAVGAWKNTSYELLLEPEYLRQSYEAAYQILFARMMHEVLDQNFTKAETVSGMREYRTQAVVMVPAYTYLVEALLGAIIVVCSVLLCISFLRPRKLRSDPASLAAVMSLVADDDNLLKRFSHLDYSNEEEITKALEKEKFRLAMDEGRCMLRVQSSTDDLASDDENTGPRRSREDGLEASRRRAATLNIEKPKSVMPYEFRFLVTAIFTILQLAVLIILIVLWIKAKPYGLPLPSQNQFVRQLLENYIPTAIATFIEPVWLVITRLLGLLQPFMELRRGPVPADKSLALEYNSLPPQLFIVKALRARHFMLVSLCSLVLLANILAIAFSGLFFENTIRVPKSHEFQPAYMDKFVSINGTVGPQYTAPDGEDQLRNGVASGAYSGGGGLDQFYTLVSNLTAGTPLPVWTDERYFYVPFESTTNNTKSENTTARQLEATTTAFGAELSCTELTPGIGSGPNSYNLTIVDDINNAANMSVTMQHDSGSAVTCSINNTIILHGPIQSGPEECPRGLSALELILSPNVSSNETTQEEYNFCSTLILAVWSRHSSVCNRNYTDLTSTSTLALGCQPSIAAGDAEVTVDGAGRIQRVSPFNTTTAYEPSKHFSNAPREFFRQAHQYFINNQQNNGEGTGRTWHNDSLASDFHNYLIAKRNISGAGHALVDPKAPAPDPKLAARAFGQAYAEIFAIWMGSHADRLLLLLPPSANRNVTAGHLIAEETRIFLSTPMFAIAVAILSLYVVMPTVVFLRRPGAFLPQLPTTLASLIAMVAASGAVRDMKGTSGMSGKERKKWLEGLSGEEEGYGQREYAYGSYVGVDGRVHVGVEKAPFVSVRVPLGGKNGGKAGWWKRKKKGQEGEGGGNGNGNGNGNGKRTWASRLLPPQLRRKQSGTSEQDGLVTTPRPERTRSSSDDADAAANAAADAAAGRRVVDSSSGSSSSSSATSDGGHGGGADDGEAQPSTGRRGNGAEAGGGFGPDDGLALGVRAR